MSNSPDPSRQPPTRGKVPPQRLGDSQHKLVRLGRNSSAVKMYNAASSVVRFENKNIFFYSEKRFILLQRCRCSCKFTSRGVGSRLGEVRQGQVCT
jgi:hypothetical protein